MSNKFAGFFFNGNRKNKRNLTALEIIKAIEKNDRMISAVIFSYLLKSYQH